VRILIASSARRHGIGKRRILGLLLEHEEVIDITRPGDVDPKICFLSRGVDGIEWEVIAVVLTDMLLVIHAMPTQYRPPHFSWRTP
jgi:hypothetical protein